MSEYGLTPKGPNIKRLDVILNEMHADLSEKLGINTRQNPQSILNHLLTNIADRIAELWEFGENVYYSQYPSTAEGISLDNACQLGGVIRKGATRSSYPIHCTGLDGTVLPSGTKIASNTNPVTTLSVSTESRITRTAFNKITLKIVYAARGETYTVTIDGNTYSFTATSDDPNEILHGLQTSIGTAGEKIASEIVLEDDHYELKLERATYQSGTAVFDEAALSASSLMYIQRENLLTTGTVTSIINFSTDDFGDILLPSTSINKIVNAPSGLLEVANHCTYVAGNDEETDSELRKSYIDKIFNRSSMMVDSIESAILNNVKGVKSCYVYENNTDDTDENGIPPHSIEVVVSGGDANDIAREIYINKAAGIGTYGNTSVDVTAHDGGTATVYYTVPSEKYVWFYVKVTPISGTYLQPDFVDIVKEIITEDVAGRDIGEGVILQAFYSEICRKISGVREVSILAYQSDENVPPVSSSAYEDINITVSNRQFVYTTPESITVVEGD